MLSLAASVLCLTLPLSTFGLGTRVIQTHKGPTGYEVTFVYTPSPNETYSNVLLGGFPLYSDPLGASLSYTDAIPPAQWKPDCFSMGLKVDYNPNTYSGFNMTLDKSSGNWTITLPFPSGTFNYAYYPDCTEPWNSGNCTSVIDPSNVPFERVLGDQHVSNIQVPFDAQFQKNDYDWQLPLAVVEERGSISYHQYPLKSNASFLAAVGVYLPREYGTIANKTYPTLYLHHGGGGTESDWFTQGRVQNIIDRLINSGVIEPTVIITPNSYTLPFTQDEYATTYLDEYGYDTIGLDAYYNAIREEYQSSLIPWVEANYAVALQPARRAFSGLSLGGGLAMVMLLNATSTFGSFCPMSNTPAPLPGAYEYSNPHLKKVGIFTGAGFYDNLLLGAQGLQNSLTAAGVRYLSHVPLQGAHQWSTWQEVLYYYFKYGLWHPTPLVLHPAQGPFDLSGGAPY